ILNIVHSQVHVILSQFDIGLLPRNKFTSELMAREVKKESTSVACSFMAVLFEQGLDFGPFMNISLRSAESLSRVEAMIPLPTRKRYPVESTFKRTKFHYLSMSVLKATKLTG
ncbi:hypothetical protein IFM89_030068, partial [Coptis chinensis]